MVQARLPEVWYGSAPAAASEVRGYDFAELGTHNEVYRGTDGHLHALFFSGNGPIGWDDLTWAATGAPQPSGDPSAYFFAQNGTHHVLYRTSNGHLHGLALGVHAVSGKRFALRNRDPLRFAACASSCSHAGRPA